METPITQAIYECRRYGDTFHHHHHHLSNFFNQKYKLQLIIIKINFLYN